jgi:membrane protein YqaA with SNARE-associated domain
MELPDFLVTVQEICGGLVQKYGAWGVAAAMLIESAGVPFTSTVVLLTVGGMILSGRAGFWVLLLASTAGIILGSMISYIVGFLGGSLSGGPWDISSGTTGRRMRPPGALPAWKRFMLLSRSTAPTRYLPGSSGA